MGAPEGDGGAGLLDLLKEMIERLRVELTNKINADVGDVQSDLDKKFKDLTERLAKCEIDTKLTDNRQQEEIDALSRRLD